MHAQKQEASMAIAARMAETTWGGPLASGTGLIRLGSGAVGELAVTWASRTGRQDGKTSPEELAAAAH
jgi:lipoyl-dependent peroxiredoxin